MHASILEYLHGIPSAVISCILQQADIMRIANLSTTKIRHSFAFGFNAGDFPLKRITSFIISAKNNQNKGILEIVPMSKCHALL